MNTHNELANTGPKVPAGPVPAKTQRPRRMARELADGSNAPKTNGTPAEVQPDKPLRITKTSAVLALLQREAGATLAELIEATGWLPHTTRAALTGLKKKGHVIAREGAVSLMRTRLRRMECGLWRRGLSS